MLNSKWKIVIVMVSVGVVSMFSSSANAMQKVSDAQLENISGSSQFTDIPCGVQTSPPICDLDPDYSAQCAWVPNQAGGRDYYKDSHWPAYTCVGEPKPNPPHCNKYLNVVDTVQRRFYSLTPRGLVCDDDGQDSNYSETVWSCAYNDCRIKTFIQSTGQNVH